MSFVVILAALHLAVPVRCYESQPAWEARGADFGISQPAWTRRYAAYYLGEQPGEPAHIALGPDACREVRHATGWGAFVLGHEFGHRWQDVRGLPYDEAQADRIAFRSQARWQARLRAFFRVPPDPPIVRLEAP